MNRTYLNWWTVNEFLQLELSREQLLFAAWHKAEQETPGALFVSSQFDSRQEFVTRTTYRVYLIQNKSTGVIRRRPQSPNDPDIY